MLANGADWIAKCRTDLIEKEKLNLETRAKYWKEIVNMKTNEFNESLNIRLTETINSGNKSMFDYRLDPYQHLTFLTEWKGLKTQKMSKIPADYSDFQFKAKNWLCGRRAPNYATTLFPDMINAARQFSERLSLFMFNDNNEIRNLYSMGLMYGYLSCLCSVKISLSDRSKKVLLLYENSIKSVKTATSRLLQSYAMDYPNYSAFPSNRSVAHEYFENKYESTIKILKPKLETFYQTKQQQQYNNNNVNTIKPVQMQNVQNVHQSTLNHIPPEQQYDNKQLFQLITNISSLQQKQERYMNRLQARVDELENILKNQFKGNNNNNYQIGQSQQNVHYHPHSQQSSQQLMLMNNSNPNPSLPQNAQLITIVNGANNIYDVAAMINNISNYHH